jgi:hypothetical protein
MEECDESNCEIFATKHSTAILQSAVTFACRTGVRSCARAVRAHQSSRNCCPHGHRIDVPVPPLYNRWAQEYDKRNSKIQMRYVPMGTSEGIKQISHGSGDFAAGEALLTATEQREGSLMELPAYCHENYLRLCRFLLQRQCDRVAQTFQAMNQVSREVVLVELV